MKNQSCRKFCFLMPLVVLGFVALFTYAVYALWNGVLAEVVPVQTITYWQALGLLVLAKILFGGFPGRCGPGGPPWRDRAKAKHWESLTPEQREHMREEMRHRFGAWPRPWCNSGDAETEASDKPKDV
jgi:hypothetical protein